MPAPSPPPNHHHDHHHQLVAHEITEPEALQHLPDRNCLTANYGKGVSTQRGSEGAYWQSAKRRRQPGRQPSHIH